MQSDVLSIERDGHVATLWLDRPEQHNAMGPSFWADLPGAMAELDQDPAVRVVVLAARGRHFTAGLDLAAMAGDLIGDLSGNEESSSPAARAAAFLRAVGRLQQAITSVERCAKPVIAAVHGACIGGGVDLITACDIRLCSANATFSVRETRLAMVADVGTLQRLPRIVGRGHAAELALTGRDIGAERARAIGLVNDVLADVHALHAAAAALAGEIAANPPLAVQGTKHVLRVCEDRSIDEGLDYVAVWNAAFLRSDDLTEAMAAFFQKRPPRFTGS
ncbi:MAG: crotonase/enoyl-CoA hydratase family protein [Acidimicrobiales bacterium]